MGVGLIRKGGLPLANIHSGNTEIWRLNLRRAIMKKEGKWYKVVRIFAGDPDNDSDTSQDFVEEISEESAKRAILNPDSVEL